MAELPKDLRVLVSELARLEVEQIARALEHDGVKGRPGSVWCCPIVNYLKHQLGGSYVVGRQWIGKYYPRRPGGRDKPEVLERIRTPSAVAEFIERFDRKEFPRLIGKARRVRKARSGPKRVVRKFVARQQTAAIGGR